jgi:hypothetical protein
MTFNISTAAIFRLVTQGPITLLFDEIDAVFNPKTASNYEDLRALLNAGYKRTATVARCVGDASNMAVSRFSVYAPVALAGIAGGMPATITTRAITVHMRKSAPHERAEQFREKRVEREATPIREALAAWTESIGERIAEAEPAMPDGVTDRAAEIWEPLLAIADAAGGHWPATARAACRHFVLDGSQEATSLGVRLLGDLRDLYASRDTDRMTTEDIVAELCRLDEAPWADLYGKGLNGRLLARELGRYGVKSKDIKLPGNRVLKGYRMDGDDGLADAWSRYLPSAATSATGATPQVNQVADEAEVADTCATPEVPRGTEVADTNATAHTSATGLTCAVAEVAEVAHRTGGMR